MPKYVVSRTLKEPLPWPNSTLLDGELTKAVTTLRKKDAKDIVILGSGEVVRTLLAKHLLDELILLDSTRSSSAMGSDSSTMAARARCSSSRTRGPQRPASSRPHTRPVPNGPKDEAS